MILEYSGMESETYKVNSQMVNLRELFSKLNDIFSPAAVRKKLKLEISINETINEIKSNKVLLENIFMNLVDNAIKFTSTG